MKNLSEKVSVGRLRDILVCDFDNGLLFWKARGVAKFDNRFAGKMAFSGNLGRFHCLGMAMKARNSAEGAHGFSDMHGV